MFLVTGGAGFIGSHVVERLHAMDVPVRVLDDLSTGRLENLGDLNVDFVRGSVADTDLLVQAMEGCTHVIHLAALASVPASCDDPVSCSWVNVQGTVMVFQAARAKGIRRVVYASSSAVYGNREGWPKHEDDPLDLASPYAASKASDEMYGSVFSRGLGIECVGLRYFNVFGPRQDPRGPYAAVVPRFIERALVGRELEIFGDGEQARDLVSVWDAASATLLAASAPGIGGRVYNVGTGRKTSIRDVASTILEHTGHRSQLRHLPPRPGDVRISVADIGRARTELGWEPRHGLEDALKGAIEHAEKGAEDEVSSPRSSQRTPR